MGDNERGNVPEAPAGSYRRKDLESSALESGGHPKSQLGIDGKVYDFITAPEDASESDGGNAQQSLRKLKEAKKAMKEKKGKDGTKKKKGKKKGSDSDSSGGDEKKKKGKKKKKAKGKKAKKKTKKKNN